MSALNGTSAFPAAVSCAGPALFCTGNVVQSASRTLQPSGVGSDHGWGSHHLILGGAVQGGRIYGGFPTLALGGDDDSGSRGALIPTTSIEQYAATLAKWLGVSDTDLPLIFQSLYGNLADFGGQPTLNFMG